VPRVSDEHLTARREQILDAARACFVRNGFHQTSMQDVIREAGLSVGAVYRYFPSKTDLIMAIAERVIAQVAGVFDHVLAEEPPPPMLESLERVVDLVTANTGPGGVMRFAVQVWGESTTDPTLASFVDTVYRRIRELLVALVQRAIDRGELPAGTDAGQVGVVLFSLMPGYGLQRILTGGPEPEVFKAGLRALLDRGLSGR
jgi:AcrR family transcriptional regulator